MIIKQEAKKDGAVVRQEEETKVTENVASAYEQMYETVASGFVADELPFDLVEKFLTAVKSSNVFIG